MDKIKEYLSKALEAVKERAKEFVGSLVYKHNERMATYILNEETYAYMRDVFREDFIEVVRGYCSENEIDLSRFHERATQTKRMHPDSHLALFQEAYRRMLLNTPATNPYSARLSIYEKNIRARFHDHLLAKDDTIENIASSSILELSENIPLLTLVNRVRIISAVHSLLEDDLVF